MSVLLCPAPPAPGACTFFVSLLWKPLRDFTSFEVQISDYDTAILNQPVMSQNALSLVNSSRTRSMRFQHSRHVFSAISRHPASRSLAWPKETEGLCAQGRLRWNAVGSSQASKAGCHELLSRAEGILSIGTPCLVLRLTEHFLATFLMLS